MSLVRVECKYIKGTDNVVADYLSRESVQVQQSDNYLKVKQFYNTTHNMFMSDVYNPIRKYLSNTDGVDIVKLYNHHLTITILNNGTNAHYFDDVNPYQILMDDSSIQSIQLPTSNILSQQSHQLLNISLADQCKLIEQNIQYPLTEQNLQYHLQQSTDGNSLLPMHRDDVSSISSADDDDSDIVHRLQKIPSPSPFVQPQDQLTGQHPQTSTSKKPRRSKRLEAKRKVVLRHIPLEINTPIPMTNKQLKQHGAHQKREAVLQTIKNKNVSIINDKPSYHAWNHDIFKYKNKTHIPIKDNYTKIFTQNNRIKNTLIRYKQWEDSICFIILNFLKAGHKGLINDLPKYIKRYVLSGRFVINSDNILCFKHTRSQKLLQVVPASLLATILKYAHSEYHHGSTRMALLITNKMGYWWPKMNYHIKTYCRCCISCQHIKTGVARSYNKGKMKLYIATRPFEQISVDIVGPLPTTPTNHRYIVTMLDKFSRYCMLVPVTDITALSVVKAIDRWVTTFGPPESILSDNGPQFISSVYADYMQNHKDIKYRYTSTYHPECNGQIERLHRWIKERLALIAYDEAKDFINGEQNWSDYLSIIQYTYNSTPNKMTTYSPMHIVLGRDDYTIKEYSFNTNNPKEYIDFMANRQGIIQYRARERQNVYDKLRQNSYNKNRSKKRCEIGDKVLWNINHHLIGSQKKLGPKWVGPYEVVDIFNDYQKCRIWIMPLPPLEANNPMNPQKIPKRTQSQARNRHQIQEFNVARKHIKPCLQSYEQQFDGTQSPNELSINLLSSKLYSNDNLNNYSDYHQQYHTMFYLYSKQKQMGYTLHV